jgi:hypothetical protein
VIRGINAIGLIYQMSNRAPALIQQSHLEKSEGKFYLRSVSLYSFELLIPSSLGRLLVAYLPIVDRTMYKPLS